MGCGCNQPQARRPVASMAHSPTHGVLSGVATNPGLPPKEEGQNMSEERRKIEKLRRDAILRALGRP